MKKFWLSSPSLGFQEDKEKMILKVHIFGGDWFLIRALLAPESSYKVL